MNIYNINIEKVSEKFLNYCGILKEEANDYFDLVINAVSYIEDRLSKAPVNVSEENKCEFAACAVAVYDYTLIEILKEKQIVTSNGTAVENYKETPRYQAAFALRQGALSQISSLCSDENFVFQGVDG